MKEADYFGFQLEVLAEYLTFETARPFLKEGVVEADWEHREPTEANLREGAAKYAAFAWTKVADHRGLSAGRNIEKMKTFLWLLGKEAEVDLNSIPYPQYGAPQLAALCAALGLPVPSDAATQNMIAGRPCVPGCLEGCGR